MNIAFYATMKSPHHPVPSGDRLMSRLLMQALGGITDALRLASSFRAYSRVPDNDLLAERKKLARAEADRLIAEWTSEGWRPDVWISYHPYYKAPDWIGPVVAEHFSCALMTVEASFAARRATDAWSRWHAENLTGLQRAACHFYMTERDRAGLAETPGLDADLVHLPPFIDTSRFAQPVDRTSIQGPLRLVTVAMMRRDVKLTSYEFLARALADAQDVPWTLDIVGDGDARSEVGRAFSSIDPRRITWHGRLDQDGVRNVLQRCELFAWPGFGEAYGLAYLEAQAAGLPVLAQRSAGVPEVVVHGETGLLVPENDLVAFTAAIRELMVDRTRIQQLGLRAREFVLSERNQEAARRILSDTIDRLVD